MKKTRVLGAALTLAAVLAVGSAMGQVPVPLKASTNFVEIKSGTSDDASLVQKGIDHGFYVIPDDAFHSTYTTDGKLTSGFKWDWNVYFKPAAATVTPATFNDTADGTTKSANFSKFQFSAPGLYCLNVKETAPAAYGGCSGALRTFKVYAFDAPSLENITSDATNAECVAAGSTLLKNPHFKFYSSGSPYVKYKIKTETGTVGPTGVTWTAIADLLTTQTVTVPAASAWAWNKAASTVPADLTANGTNLTLTAALDTATALGTNAPKLAEYNFEIAYKLPAPTGTVRLIRYTFVVEGINGLLSRKAEHDPITGNAPVAGYSYVTNITSGKQNSVSYLVAVAPVTGPVYHVGNNKAN